MANYFVRQQRLGRGNWSRSSATKLKRRGILGAGGKGEAFREDPGQDQETKDRPVPRHEARSRPFTWHGVSTVQVPVHGDRHGTRGVRLHKRYQSLACFGDSLSPHVPHAGHGLGICTTSLVLAEWLRSGTVQSYIGFRVNPFTDAADANSQLPNRSQCHTSKSSSPICQTTRPLEASSLAP